MKNLIVFAVLAAGASIANADPTFQATGSHIRAPGAKSHHVGHAQARPTPIMDIPQPLAVPTTESVTVTGTRPHSFDFHGSESFVDFRSTAPRSLSDPPAVVVAAEPVQLTLGTGNTPALRQTRIDFPFENPQDRTVRESDVLKVSLARFKFE